MCLTTEEKKILDCIPSMIMVTDHQGQILFINKQLCQNFGITTKKIQKQNALDFVCGEQKELVKKKLKQLLKKGQTKEVNRFQIIAPLQEKKIIEINSEKRESEIFHSLKDITESQQKEEKLERVYKSIELINSILRHDLLNNFSVIKSGLRLLCVDIQGLAENNKYIKEIQKKISSSVSLINTMKKFSETIKSHQLEEYSLGRIFENIASSYDNLLFRIEGDSEVYADKTIYSTITNIFNNALRHGQADEIKVIIEKEKRNTVVKIYNNGLPIENEILPKIFQQGKKGKTGNTGIGLYIVQENMLRYNGSVKAENTTKGVCFTLEFQSL